MGVQDGFPVSAGYTNPRFISKNTPDVMPFPLGFTGSGAAIADIQAAVNKLYTASGASESTTGTVYNATPGTVSNGDTYEDCITILADKFDAATGHMHTGADGDGPVLEVVLSVQVSGTGGTPETGNITLTPGSGMMISQSGTDFTFASAAGTTIAASGNTPLVGDVILQAGTNISLAQTGQVIQINSSGGGGTGINYITNPEAVTDTSGWATYANTPGPVPVDGTGGSPSITLTRTTSNPLRGVASFLLSKDAADRQGEGVSTDFTIDIADQAALLAVSFNYQVDSPFVPSDGSSLSDIEVFIYDITNAVLIPVVPNTITTLGPNAFTFQGNFQAAPNSLSYRLIFHITSTNASAYDFKFDNVSVGPNTAFAASNAVASKASLSGGVNLSDSTLAVVPFDTIGYDNTGSFTLGSNAEFIAPVSGDYQINGTVEFAANSTGQRSISIFVNGSEYTSLANESNPSATLTARVAGSDVIKVNAGDSVQIFAFQSSGGLLVIGGGGALFTHMSIALLQNPAQGISRGVVVASAGVTNSFSIPDTTPTLIPYDTLFFDSTDSFNTTTSAGNFIASISGFYNIEVLQEFAPSAVGSRTLFVYKNGSPLIGLCSEGNPSAALGCLPTGSTTIQALAGDLIQIFAQQTSGGSLTLSSSGASFSHVAITKVNNPAAPVQGDTVACGYTIGSPALSIPTTTDRIITYRTLLYDTTASYNASTGLFTVPLSGIYSLKANIEFVGQAADFDHRLKIYRNGSEYRDLVVTGAFLVGILSGTTDLQLTAGETIEFYAFQNSGSTLSLGNSGDLYSFMSITKVG